LGNASPPEAFQHALYAFFEVQSAEVEALDVSCGMYLLNHVNSVLDTKVLDQAIIVLERFEGLL
jgi:hypothetical protein